MNDHELNGWLDGWMNEWMNGLNDHEWMSSII